MEIGHHISMSNIGKINTDNNKYIDFELQSFLCHVNL